jgi:hypothetical protein
MPLPLKVINVVSSANGAVPLLPRFRTYCCVASLGDQSVDARRGAAVGGELRQAAGAVASVAAHTRGVTRSRSRIHDGPRNARLSPQFCKYRHNGSRDNWRSTFVRLACHGTVRPGPRGWSYVAIKPRVHLSLRIGHGNAGVHAGTGVSVGAARKPIALPAIRQ